MFEGQENFEGEKKIAEMLSSLQRIDAPGDFNARVRARIARRATVPVDRRPWATGFFRIGVPLLAAFVIGLGGYLVFKSISADQNNVPPVAESRNESQNPTLEQPTSNIETSESAKRATVKPGDEVVADNLISAARSDNAEPNGPNSTVSNTPKDRPRGGSIDMSAPVASPKIYPRGLNPSGKVPSNAAGVNPNARIHVSQLLEFFGVKATWANNGWRVDSVEANNIGERSGIKTGDIIEAVNEKRVDENSTFPAKFDGKSLRVRRDGASLQIDFKP